MSDIEIGPRDRVFCLAGRLAINATVGFVVFSGSEHTTSLAVNAFYHRVKRTLVAGTAPWSLLQAEQLVASGHWIELPYGGHDWRLEHDRVVAVFKRTGERPAPPGSDLPETQGGAVW